jgi:hypothetical protein
MFAIPHPHVASQRHQLSIRRMPIGVSFRTSFRTTEKAHFPYNRRRLFLVSGCWQPEALY